MTYESFRDELGDFGAMSKHLCDPTPPDSRATAAPSRPAASPASAPAPKPPTATSAAEDVEEFELPHAEPMLFPDPGYKPPLPPNNWVDDSAAAAAAEAGPLVSGGHTFAPHSDAAPGAAEARHRTLDLMSAARRSDETPSPGGSGGEVGPTGVVRPFALDPGVDYDRLTLTPLALPGRVGDEGDDSDSGEWETVSEGTDGDGGWETVSDADEEEGAAGAPDARGVLVRGDGLTAGQASYHHALATIVQKYAGR